MTTITIAQQMKALGLAPSSHDSLRRAIQRILDKSEGPVPEDDLRAILKLVATAL